MSTREKLLPIDERSLHTAVLEEGVVTTTDAILAHDRLHKTPYVLRNFVSRLLAMDQSNESARSLLFESSPLPWITERVRSGSIFGIGLEHIQSVFQKHLQKLPPDLRSDFVLGPAARWKRRGEIEYIFDDLGIYRAVSSFPQRIQIVAAKPIEGGRMGSWETMPPEVRMVYGGEWQNYPSFERR